MRRMQFLPSLAISATLILGCQTDKPSPPGNAPSSTDGVGHLDSVEKDIVSSDESEISLGNTSLKFPKDSWSANYRVRISRLNGAPELSEGESLVLGDAQGDIVDVELYDPTTSKTLASSELSSAYEFKQTFRTSNSSDQLGLMVITDRGTSSEQRVLLPRSELNISNDTALALSGSSVTVRVSLKLTVATLWMVTYRSDALNNLVIGTAATLSSQGGGAPNELIIKTSSIADASLKINDDASYVTTDSVTLNLVATGATEMYITNAAGCAAGGHWEAFSSSRSWTLGSLNSVSRVYAKFRDANGNSSRCVSDSITHDDIPPAPPTLVLDGSSSSSLTSSPTISWTASSSADVSHYEVAIGSSVGAIDQKSWTKSGKVTSATITGLNLSDNTTYYPSVRAVDMAGLVSQKAEGDGWNVVTSSLNCPSGYVKTPANAALGTSEFCVMKYEAKNVGGVPTSQAALSPWININRGLTASSSGSAWKACKDIAGGGYDLLTNAQWQAIARNIESVAANWSLGSVGSDSNDGNSLNRGHSDNNPSSACDALIENLKTNCSSADPAAPHSQKRTHTLSNGDVIWDVAGNVWEWVQDNINTYQGVDEFVSQMTSPGYNLLKWGPAGQYLSKNAIEFGGLGYARMSFTGKPAILRGGHFTSSTMAGIFTTELDKDPTSDVGPFGFRCTFNGSP